MSTATRHEEVPQLRVNVLVRSLLPGSFTRLAIEDVFWLNKIPSVSGRLVAFGINFRGYHLEDLIEARKISLEVSTLPRWLERVATRLLILLTPDIRGEESVVPIHNIVSWSLRDRTPSDVNYGEDQFTGLACLIKSLLHRTPYVLLISEPVSDVEGIKNLRIGRSRLAATLLAWPGRVLERTILSRARRLVFISDRTRRAIRKRFPQISLESMPLLVPGCYPVQDISQPELNPPFLLSISKWDQGRNPTFALELAIHAGVKLVLAGSWMSGSFFEQFRSEVAKRTTATHLVDVTGPLSQASLDSLSSHAYSYVHWNPEGFGLGVLEAMARGVPVICTSEAGASELLNDGGGIVITESTREAFVGAVQRLLDSKSYRDQLATEALKTATRHTWQEHAIKLAKILASSCNHELSISDASQA